jgi:hypothetical protein
MSGEFIEFFQQLLLGSGAFFGFLIIESLIIGLATKLKEIGVLMLLPNLILAFEYLSNVSTNTDLAWYGVMTILIDIFLIWYTIKHKD